MKRTTELVIFGLVLALGELAGAQVVTEVPAQPNTGASTEMRRVSQILGATVQLQGVNNFGRVEDAVLDDRGAIAYLVVSSNGKNVMLPWSEAKFDFGHRVVTYSITPQVIQPLFFEANAWPNVWGPPYMGRIRHVFPNAVVTRHEVLRPIPPTTPPPIVPAP